MRYSRRRYGRRSSFRGRTARRGYGRRGSIRRRTPRVRRIGYRM